MQRAGALSVALNRRPQPVNIPAEGSSAEPSPDMLPPHAAVIGSPTTTAPIMASIRRTRSSGEDGMQVGVAVVRHLHLSPAEPATRRTVLPGLLQAWASCLMQGLGSRRFCSLGGSQVCKAQTVSHQYQNLCEVGWDARHRALGRRDVVRNCCIHHGKLMPPCNRYQM